MIDTAPILGQFPAVALDAATGSLLVPCDAAADVARFLRDDPRYRMDYLSNVTGVDYPEGPLVAAGEGDREPANPGRGCIDVIYHLYSMSLRHGPLVLRQRARPRARPVAASLTPVWRGAEFQEREVFDLFGVRFDGHPDLRRILTWRGFEGHPMRKDYVPQDQDALPEDAEL